MSRDLEQEAAAVFKALQTRAREEHDGNTGALMVVYAVESFLRRLALSRYAERMVLKRSTDPLRVPGCCVTR